MKIHASAVGLALLLGACAGDPWPGVYDGTVTTEGSTCDGALLDPDTKVIAVRVERGMAGLFINGTCLLTLQELSSTSARVRPTTCESVVGDELSRFTVIEGRAQLAGSRLGLEYTVRVESLASSGCVEALATFEGTRR